MSKFDEQLEKALAEEEEKKKKKKTYGKSSLAQGRYSYLPTSRNTDVAPIFTTTKKDDDEDDIAPIKSTKDDGKLDFFQKSSLFDDGWDFGDITKTILGSVGDAGVNIVKGVGGLVEGITDLGSYGVAGVADAIGKDSFADDLRKKTQESYVDKLMKPAEDYLDKRSIFGRTSDSILKGVGQVGGIMATGGLGAAGGLGAGGVTALTTGVMGLSGMGSGMGEAYQGGATDEEAVTYGAISGAADAISELIFGGLGKAVNAVGFSRGLSSADDMLAKKVSSMFSNQIMKNLSEFGIKAGAEGFEEVLAGIAQAAGKKATYMSEEEFGKILKDENLLEQFVVGAVTSGIAQVPGLHIANKTGSDFITGLNQNEQAVVKKEVENRIAEAEADGTKLTAKEKAAIEAQVEKDLEKGYISTDLIEEVVGGYTYKAYKDSEAREDALFQEYEELGKATNPTLAQQYRYRELDSQVKSIKDNDIRSRRKEHLDQFVSEQVNGSRLAESYNEKARRGQAFEADLTKYDAKQHAVIQKAVESGILNNTNRTHEFVDMVAKISADKGVLFDFTNNEKLKNSGFAVDGKAVNGYVTKDGITVNIQSSKALNSIVGHEITHVLEGTDLYTELQAAVVEYAKTKGDYQGRFDSLSTLYEAVEGADINAELTADLVGDYLFTDADFINSLSTQHRNVFQKIYDEVKYLLKVATAGSKEARELEKVKRAFEKAYREGENARQIEEISDSKTKYSIREEAPPKNTGVAYKVFFVKDGKLYPPMVANPGGADTPMGVWLNADMGTAAPPSKTGRAQVKAGGKGTQGGSGSLAFRPGWHLGDLPRASQFDRVNPETGKKELFPENFVWAEVEYAKDVDYQEEAMSYGYTDKGKFRHAYAGLPRLPENGYYRYRTNPKPDTVPWVITGAMKVNRLLSDAEVNAILEKNGVPPVHRQGGDVGLDKFGFNDDGTVKYSLSAEQQEFFKDSVVRDENGNLKVMYHGTSAGGHTMFDPYGKARYGLFGAGSYFTDSKSVAEGYTKKGKGKNPQVYETYLNIKNPMDMDAAADPAAWAKAFPDASFPDSGTNEQFYRAMEEYFEDEMYPRWEAAEEAMMAIEDMGYDGITHIGGGRFNKSDSTRHRVYIAFQPEQIKNIDNTKPTENPDIRYSLSEDSDGNKLTEEQAEYFKKSKMRDATGNLKPMYHGSKDGGFHVFDRRYSDDHTSFFFVDSNDVASSYSGTSETYAARSFKTAEDLNKFFAEIEKPYYEVVEEDGKFVFMENGDVIAESDTALGAYEEFCDWEGVGYGDINYKVYLNLENPLEVDANGREWDEIQIPEEHLAKFNESVFGKTDANGFSSTATTRNFSEYANAQGYDGVIFKNILDVGGYGGKYNPHTVAIAFDSNQIKSVANEKPTSAADIRYSLSEDNQIKAVTNQNPTDNPDIHRSLSAEGKKPKAYGSYNVYGKDVALEIAPVEENATTETRNATPNSTEQVKTQLPEENATTETRNATPNSTEQVKTQLPEENATVSKTETTTEDSSVAEDLFPDDLAPVQQELDNLLEEQDELRQALEAAVSVGDYSQVSRLTADYESVTARIKDIQAQEDERLSTLGEADMPPEVEAPYSGEPSEPADPFADRDMQEVGNRNIKAYQYENPEVKPFFREAALGMLDDLSRTTRGEKIFNGDLYYQSGGEDGWMGTKRQTTDDIAELLDSWHYTYDQIEKGLNAIIEDDGKENNAVSKRIEFLLDERLRNGYTDVWGEMMPANQEYINLLNEKQITEYSQEAFNAYFDSLGDNLPPEAMEPEGDIAPVVKPAPAYKEATASGSNAIKGQQALYYEAITPKKQSKKSNNRLVRADKATTEQEKIAQILDSEPAPETRKSRAWARFKANVLDKGAVFEDLALKTRNRELMGKWNYIISSEARAQRLMGNGAEGVKSLNAIREKIEGSGKAKQFYEYLYHKHNVDRMQLAERYEDTPNKPVFSYSVTAEVSQSMVDQYEKSNPAFKKYAQDVYDYMNHLRSLLVDNGVISQKTADLWADMYPHYVPIRRAGDTGLNINVPLDTGRTTVNAPVKRATGGNSDILPLFDTMGQRTIQTFKAIAKNSFGVELKNALGTTVENTETSVDEVIESIDTQEGLLQKGKNGSKPTFTVFENGEKVTFSITEDMYDALKPVSEGMAYTNKIANTISNFHRGLLTEYNPVFMLTNAIKDSQDILINSQHPARTYAKIPEAYWQQFKKGYWYQEYMANGGEQNTYFDNESNTFDTEHKGFGKLLDAPPLNIISKLNNLIEMTPRLAEYIASREAGRSVEVSMLDAARVTTNFAAGGDLTKFLNRNGATFLNASVQGVMQNVRNFREAKAAGWKGWANLATKFAVAGLPAVLLNNLVWDDDEEYEELSDYVKQNYYIVGKYGDGKFIRIPKGRTLAVIQAAFEQIGNAVTGNDEVDLGSFLELVVSNLAPNNPVEDNILAPIIQVAKNETWYGEDLVPTRLQNLPAAEQFDESTDKFSKWLGEKLGVSPVKINYLLDQYSGGVGDTILPMLTPEAESGDNSFIGNMLAPLKSKFTADSVMNNQNVSDFYDTKDELTVKANASTAADKDVLMSKYINSVNAELSELYAQKREIQNSSLPDDVKYEQVREVQKQIVDLTRNALKTYESVAISGEYAEVGGRYFNEDEEGDWRKLTDEQAKKYEVTNAAGDSSYATDGTVHYRWYVKEGETEGEWRKISDDQLEKQKEVTSGLGISAAEYWSNKEEYDYAYEHPENYAVAKAVGGYESYKSYSGELYGIKADKDENGKSISGSRKEKVLDYINNLDIDYGEKLILFKNEYNADDTYNQEIIDYLNGRSDISFEEEVTILRKLGFTVTADGTIYWD